MRVLTKHILIGISIMALYSCGRMTVTETKYFAVPNGDNVNYYRLNLMAKTKLGVADYKSGWFPRSSVDKLFGAVTSEEGANALEVRENLRKQINERAQKLNQLWLDTATNPATSVEYLESLLKARSRIYAYPALTSNLGGAVMMEYNPELGNVLLHSDEKQVLILSSNPDEVIQKINSVSQNDKTVADIGKLGKLIQKRNADEAYAGEAILDINKAVDNSVIATQLDVILNVINNPASTPVQINAAIDVLVNFINKAK